MASLDSTFFGNSPERARKPPQRQQTLSDQLNYVQKASNTAGDCYNGLGTATTASPSAATRSTRTSRNSSSDISMSSSEVCSHARRRRRRSSVTDGLVLAAESFASTSLSAAETSSSSLGDIGNDFEQNKDWKPDEISPKGSKTESPEDFVFLPSPLKRQIQRFDTFSSSASELVSFMETEADKSTCQNKGWEAATIAHDMRSLSLCGDGTKRSPSKAPAPPDVFAADSKTCKSNVAKPCRRQSVEHTGNSEFTGNPSNLRNNVTKPCRRQSVDTGGQQSVTPFDAESSRCKTNVTKPCRRQSVETGGLPNFSQLPVANTENCKRHVAQARTSVETGLETCIDQASALNQKAGFSPNNYKTNVNKPIRKPSESTLVATASSASTISDMASDIVSEEEPFGNDSKGRIGCREDEPVVPTINEETATSEDILAQYKRDESRPRTLLRTQSKGDPSPRTKRRQMSLQRVKVSDLGILPGDTEVDLTKLEEAVKALKRKKRKDSEDCNKKNRGRSKSRKSKKGEKQNSGKSKSRSRSRARGDNDTERKRSKSRSRTNSRIGKQRSHSPKYRLPLSMTLSSVPAEGKLRGASSSRSCHGKFDYERKDSRESRARSLSRTPLVLRTQSQTRSPPKSTRGRLQTGRYSERGLSSLRDSHSTTSTFFDWSFPALSVQTTTSRERSPDMRASRSPQRRRPSRSRSRRSRGNGSYSDMVVSLLGRSKSSIGGLSADSPTNEKLKAAGICPGQYERMIEAGLAVKETGV